LKYKNSNCTNFYHSNDSLGLLLQNMNNKTSSINLTYFSHFEIWALYKLHNFLLANAFYCHPIWFFASQSNNFQQQCDPRTLLVVTYFSHLYVVLSLRPLLQKNHGQQKKLDIFPPLKVELCTISTNYPIHGTQTMSVNRQPHIYCREIGDKNIQKTHASQSMLLVPDSEQKNP